MYTLRPYQQKAVDAALKAKKNGVLVLPTGSGKSHIIAEYTRQAGGKTIILQPTKEILEQNLDKIIATGCFGVGVYSASVGRKEVEKITLATIGTAIKKRELFDDFDHILIDECHLVNSKGGMYEKFINGLKLKAIGLSATPFRLRTSRHWATGEPVAESKMITRTRPKIFNNILHITQIAELFESGYLSRLDYNCSIDYDSNAIAMNGTRLNFDDTALDRYNTEQNITRKIAEIVQIGKCNHYLAFTKFTKESKEVIKHLTGMNISCAEVSATTKKKDRKQILADFKSGLIKCVVNVGVLTTGFDFPELDGIILGRPTKSVALYYQMVGRGIRIAEGKSNCVLYDLCDNVSRFGKIETFEIFDQNGNKMWRLKSDKGWLTGVDINTGQNLEKVKMPARQKA